MADPRIRVATRAVIVRDNRILLVEYHHKNDNLIRYNLPGGRVEYGETLQQAVQREVFEETCVTAQIHDMLFIHEHIAVEQYGKHYIHFFFRASIEPDAVPCMPAEPDTYAQVDQAAVIWMPLSEFGDAPLYMDVNQQVLDILNTTAQR